MEAAAEGGSRAECRGLVPAARKEGLEPAALEAAQRKGLATPQTSGTGECREGVRRDTYRLPRVPSFSREADLARQALGRQPHRKCQSGLSGASEADAPRGHWAPLVPSHCERQGCPTSTVGKCRTVWSAPRSPWHSVPGLLKMWWVYHPQANGHLLSCP